MSPEHRFAVGAGYLTLPLLAGLVGFLIDWVVDLGDRPRQGVAFASIVLAGALWYVLLDPPFYVFATEVAAVAVVVPLVFEFLKPEQRHQLDERVIVFLAVLIATAVGAFAAERLRTPQFDQTVIDYGDSGRVEGGYITSTETAVVVVTGRDRCRLVQAVPRSLITRIAVDEDNYSMPPAC
jgi:hypothetical protein